MHISESDYCPLTGDPPAVPDCWCLDRSCPVCFPREPEHDQEHELGGEG